MENKILDIIIYYYTDDNEDPILFNYSAYDLYSKFETLFEELKKEIKVNLALDNESKMEYLNSFDKKLFKFYSDFKYKNSKYFYSLNKLSGDISIETRLLPILKSQLSLTHHSLDDAVYYQEQLVFFEFVKNHHLLNLSPFLKKYKKQLSKLEAKKINESLNVNIPTPSQSNLDNDTPPSIEQKLNPIFNTVKGFETFYFLLEKFGIDQSSINKRGIMSKLNGIWGCSTSKNIIFREHTALKDYVNYLNNVFGTKLNNRSMSDGSKYHQTIKNWLS